MDNADDIRNAAAALRDTGVKNVIVTLGKRGALWLAADGTEQHFPSVNVTAKDTTGAGDAFIGCFATVYVKTGDVARAITAANHYAADSVTRLGTQTSYADREAFIRFYPDFAEM